MSFTTAEGYEVPLDTSRISFMGHSQGGLTGGLALPFFDGGLGGAMLSGAGGGLAITATVRKSPIDFALLISDVLQFEDDEQVDPLHPVVGLLQWLVDSTDPLNYAPYWHHEALENRVTVPTPVLVTSGLDDAQTSYLTCLLYTSPSPRDVEESRMPSSA